MSEYYLNLCGVKITISGNPGGDAKQYQERDVVKAIREATK